MILSFQTLRKVGANSEDPDQTAVDPDQMAPHEQSDQGLHCLPFGLHLLNSLLNGRATLFKL